MVTRYASATRLLPDQADTYLELHAEVWPVVKEAIAAHHIRNHSIHRYGDILFRYYEYDGLDHDADMDALGRDARVAEWNKVTAACQEPLPEAGGSIWTSVPEICYLP